MLRYIENFGEDRDGNRGMPRVCYEVEASDYDDIKPQVDEYLSSLEQDEDPEDTLVVYLVDPVSEVDVEFTVKIKDYK